MDTKSNVVQIATEAPDPFDYRSIRLTPGTDAGVRIRKPLTTVPVRKPGRKHWFRCHPDPAHQIEVGLVDVEETGEEYLISGLEVAEALAGLYVPVALHTAYESRKVVFLAKRKLPREDGLGANWALSAQSGFERAKEVYVRLMANQALDAYDHTTTQTVASWRNARIRARQGRLSAPRGPGRSQVRRGDDRARPHGGRPISPGACWDRGCQAGGRLASREAGHIVRPVMQRLLATEQARTLKEAYDKALAQHPRLRQFSASVVAMQKKKQASNASLTGAPHGGLPRTPRKAKAGTFDDAVEDVRDAIRQLT